jgi:hypothetical protein
MLLHESLQFKARPVFMNSFLWAYHNLCYVWARDCSMVGNSTWPTKANNNILFLSLTCDPSISSFLSFRLLRCLNPSGAMPPAAAHLADPDEDLCASAASDASSAEELATPALPLPPPVSAEDRVERAWAHWTRLGSPRLTVAPMVDNSELPFRMLCRRYGVHTHAPLPHLLRERQVQVHGVHHVQGVTHAYELPTYSIIITRMGIK